MSAMDAWMATARAMESQGLTMHNLGDDIWEVADQMLAVIAELDAKVEWATGLDACLEHERADWAEVKGAEQERMLRLAMQRECEWKTTDEEFGQWLADLRAEKP